ncbi:unnamed protein product [Arabidopsis halleri]
MARIVTILAGLAHIVMILTDHGTCQFFLESSRILTII